MDVELFDLLGIILMIIIGYGSAWGYVQFLSRLDRIVQFRKTRAGKINPKRELMLKILLIAYPIFYFMKLIYLLLLETIDINIFDVYLSQEILDGFAPIIDFFWPLRDLVGLIDMFFISLAWKIFGALSFTYLIWKVGIDDIILLRNLKTTPTLRDRVIAVLLCLIILTIQVLLPYMDIIDDPTIGLVPEATFAITAMIGGILSFDNLYMDEPPEPVSST